MTDLTEKDTTFHWDHNLEAAFQYLKVALTNPPILAHSGYNEPYILTVDASENAFGMVLSQVQEGKVRVIIYVVKKYNSTERNYITEQEALACILAVKHLQRLRTVFEGKYFQNCDRSCSSKMAICPEKDTWQNSKWIAYLQQFNYTIEHRSEKKLENADGLSHTAAYSERKENDMDELDEILLPPIATKYDNQSESQQVMFTAKDQPTDRDKNTLMDIDD